MNRRALLRLLGLTPAAPAAALATAPPAPQVQPQAATWITVDCPGCPADRPSVVAFLPGQQRNTCGWCGTVVLRGMG